MPKVKITTDRTFIRGVPAVKGEVYEVSQEEADIIIANGFGEKTIIKRARTAKGQLKADDPSTPDVNEAWVGGKAPRKKK
jgi:hypothetical protein